MINLKFSPQVDQVHYLKDYHRSGWNYVVQALFKLQSDNGILCDTYVDRTFHWLRPSCIPYTIPWIGFIHHTFDTSFSNYNNRELLKNKKFINSLIFCKGIFVLSKQQKVIWEKEFSLRKIKTPIFALVHPTETPETLFTMKEFRLNQDKKIIQIGAWLRDNYAIYRLNNGNKKIKLKEKCDSYIGESMLLSKCALVGKNMEAYFKPVNFFQLFASTTITKKDVHKNSTFNSSSNLKEYTSVYDSKLTVNGFIPNHIIIKKNADCILDVDDGVCRGEDGVCRGDDGVCRGGDGMCRTITSNKYVLGAIQLLQEYDQSVSIIPYQKNKEYDVLLSKNIVFLKLVDASAVNTVLECIVRNTPIIINKLPAIVEILGEDYPLYYSTMECIEKITVWDIQGAYFYLLSLDKSKLSINYFIKSFITCLEDLN